MNVTLFESILKKLRPICLELPEANEVKSWGHPTFRAGKKSYAVLDEYDGVLGLSLKVGLDRRDALLADKRFCQTPYCGHLGWVTLKLDSRIDWKLVRRLVEDSYRLVALKRMLQALDMRA